MFFDVLKESNEKMKQEHGLPNLIIIGPSGSGKTTICQYLLKKYQYHLEDLSNYQDQGLKPIVYDGSNFNLEKLEQIQDWLIIELQISDQSAIKRLQKRQHCFKCNQVYQKSNHSFRCWNDHQPLVQIAADQLPMINQRLKTYRQNYQVEINKLKERIIINADLPFSQLCQIIDLWIKHFLKN